MKTSNGFSLIELAIVLVIVTILLGGLAIPLQAQIEARRIGETRKTMVEAQEALIGYAMTHSIASTCACAYVGAGSPYTLSTDPLYTTCPFSMCPPTSTSTATRSLPLTRHYLPCPDMSGTDPEPNLDNDGVDGLTDLNNGAEDRLNGTPALCATASGNLPWVTLGTAAQDAWGNRMHYAITSAYANSSAGFSNAVNGDKQVCNTSPSGCPVGTVASNVPVVLVSYGPNGWGGRNINGTTLALPTSADELENTDGDNSYVSRSPSKSDAAAGEFDDLVVWISKDLLISRVCQGGCP